MENSIYEKLSKVFDGVRDTKLDFKGTTISDNKDPEVRQFTIALKDTINTKFIVTSDNVYISTLNLASDSYIDLIVDAVNNIEVFAVTATESSKQYKELLELLKDYEGNIQFDFGEYTVMKVKGVFKNLPIFSLRNEPYTYHITHDHIMTKDSIDISDEDLLRIDFIIGLLKGVIAKDKDKEKNE